APTTLRDQTGGRVRAAVRRGGRVGGRGERGTTALAPRRRTMGGAQPGTDMPQSTEPRAPIVPIIGGGPAGMSCALWLHNYGMHPVIIEKEGALGGMAQLSPYPNEWLLGQRG